MEWKNLRKIKGKNVRNFLEEFRKQALNLSITLDSLQIATNYISCLHSYIWNWLLFFEPPTNDEVYMKAMHLESMGAHARNYYPKRSTKIKRRGWKPSCTITHCKGKAVHSRPSTIRTTAYRTHNVQRP